MTTALAMHNFLTAIRCMMKIFVFLSVLFLASKAFAQERKHAVKGVLYDSISTQPLINATVSVTSVNDSSNITSVLTSSDGTFLFHNIDSGSYQLIISYQGYETFRKLFSLEEDSLFDIGIVKLEKAYKVLSEVVVINKPTVSVKNDTVAYNADAFKTKPNATVEDLLKKLPGVRVDREGGVNTQGEQVQKVYVDGKEYFGDDPRLATLNLAADMIDQVQVFDDQSEQAKFSGIDDGSRSKAINLKLKKEKKTGMTGSMYAGYGTNDRFHAGARTNYFKGAANIAFVASANNISRLGMGTANIINNLNNDNGLTRSSSIGLNYRDTWSKSFDVNGSYRFSRANTLNQRNSLRQLFLKDSVIVTNREINSNNASASHRFNQRIIYTIDSLNSIVYTTNIGLRNTNLSTNHTLRDLIDRRDINYLGSASRSVNTNTGRGHSWTNNLIWRKRFNRPGRTFSVNLNGTSNANRGNAFNTINAMFYNSDNIVYRQRDADYRTGNKSRTANYLLTFSYTEPLTKTAMVELNYSHHDSRSLSDRTALALDTLTKEYKPDDTLTNAFQQRNKYNMIGANFRQVKKKYNYQVGISLQQSMLRSNNLSQKVDLMQRFTNIIPVASFNYQLARNKSLRMNYRGRNQQPNIMQLQDIIDISNYPYIRRGNPRLRQEFTHNFMLLYNAFNALTFRHMSASLFYTTTTNKIVHSTQVNGGEQTLMPVNIDGVYRVNGNFTYSLPIKSLQGGNVATKTGIGYNRDASLLNGARNTIRNMTLEEEISVSYNYGDKLDLNLTAGISYNAVDYALSKAQSQSYVVHNYTVDATYDFGSELLLSTILDVNRFSGSVADAGQQFAIWNVSLSKLIGKNNRSRLTLSVNNVLNQQNNIVRTVYENVIETVRNTVQKRFALLTFSYNLNTIIR